MDKKNDKIEEKKTDEGTEVEMSKMWQPAHETARSMLWDDPWGYVIALATMYGGRHTVVPPKEIPGMIKAFRWAKKKMIEHIDQAIAVLEEQQEEATQKKQEKEKD